MRLVWEEDALIDLAHAAEWSLRQAAAAVAAMERMARIGLCLGRLTADGESRYWPVPPLGIIYSPEGDDLVVLGVLDVRRLRTLP